MTPRAIPCDVYAKGPLPASADDHSDPGLAIPCDVYAKGPLQARADNHRNPGLDSDVLVQLFALLSLYATGRTAWHHSGTLQIPEVLPDLDPRNPNLRRVFSTLCDPDFQT